jgi:hypothetical protein
LLIIRNVTFVEANYQCILADLLLEAMTDFIENIYC